MAEHVVVLGSGYAGAGAIKSLEASLDGEATLTWVSDVDHHLVLHEAHRCICDPEVREKVAIPIPEIKSPGTAFRQGAVAEIDTDGRTVHLEDGTTIDYDYVLVGLGTQTEFYGIAGLEEHAHTLKNLDDVLGIHEDVTAKARDATAGDPVAVVVGGAGLSGIQTAGELAELRDERALPIEIHLVEGLDNVLPQSDPSLQAALRERLETRDIHIRTGEFIGEVDEDTVYVGEDDPLAYDVLVWTGGITGPEAVRNSTVEKDQRTHRIKAGQDFRTDHDRVFAIGDCALIDQPDGAPAPPTAQAAWQAAEVAGRNITRAIRGQPLEKWTHTDKGTVVSVGEAAVAHDVSVVPFVDTFGGLPASFLKKAIAARWISDVTGIGRALDAWSDM
ncbi:MAG: NADH dehydrogenase [Haloarculaceae archaeon]|jgi:NADH dehydrogenase